jgi:hypothetical protein
MDRAASSIPFSQGPADYHSSAMQRSLQPPAGHVATAGLMGERNDEAECKSQKLVLGSDSRLSALLSAIVQDRAWLGSSTAGGSPQLTMGLIPPPAISEARMLLETLGENCLHPERYGMSAPALVRAILQSGLLQRWFAAMPYVGRAAHSTLVLAIDACIQEPWAIVDSISPSVETPAGALTIGAGMATQVWLVMGQDCNMQDAAGGLHNTEFASVLLHGPRMGLSIGVLAAPTLLW